jgi:hypothetical protein
MLILLTPDPKKARQNKECWGDKVIFVANVLRHVRVQSQKEMPAGATNLYTPSTSTQAAKNCGTARLPTPAEGEPHVR